MEMIDCLLCINQFENESLICIKLLCECLRTLCHCHAHIKINNFGIGCRGATERHCYSMTHLAQYSIT